MARNISRIRAALEDEIEKKKVEASFAELAGDTSAARALNFQVEQWKEVIRNSKDIVSE